MANRRIRRFLLTVAGLLPALLASVLTAPPAWAGGTLAIGITQFPHSFHPSIDSMAATQYIHGFVRRPITAYDADWKLICLLCTELPTLDNGRARFEPVPKDVGDGTGQGIAVTYTLPPDAVWGDGTPITSADVVFTWTVGRHPKTGFTAAEGFRRILDVEVVDDKTFTLHMDRVSHEYAAINDLRLLPKHLEEAAFADPATYARNSLYTRAPETPGLWYGPWRLSAVTPGSQAVLTRNPHWWGQPPAFDRIVVKAVENTPALEATLLSGGIDMIAGEVGLGIDQALAFEERHGDTYTVLYHPALFYEHLELNQDQPALADARVRRALLLAVDRKTIVDRLFGGKLPLAVTSVSPLDDVYAADIPPVPYDPARAKDLLEAAGYRPGPDGVRINEAGDRLSLVLQTTAGNRTRERIEQVIQSMWKAVGVETVIRNEPARVLFGDTITKRKFQGAALFAWISSPENVPRTTLHCDEIPSAENTWTGQNYGGYCNPEMDRLIKAINGELDDAKRHALWRDLQAIYARDLPALPLWYQAEAYILPKWLRGVTPTGHLNYSSLWAETWRDTRD